MTRAIVNGDKEFKIDYQSKGIFMDGLPVDWDMVKVDNNRFHILHQHKSYTVDVVSADHAAKAFVLKVNNKTCRVEIKDRFDDLLHELGMDSLQKAKVPDVKAPMPGLVVDVKVEAGNPIRKGDALVVLEAMKMENILKATADGTVKAVLVKKGSKVEKNEVLVTLL
jgi:biotin carboxyl carrier protein